MAILTYDIVVMCGGVQLGSGVLTINTSSTPKPTGTFTPSDGTEVPVNFNSWSPNGAVAWSFVLTAQNGDFPIQPNGGSFTYNFVGFENGPSGPSGTVNWPVPEKGPVTWGSQPTAHAQGAG